MWNTSENIAWLLEVHQPREDVSQEWSKTITFYRKMMRICIELRLPQMNLSVSTHSGVHIYIQYTALLNAMCDGGKEYFPEYNMIGSTFRLRKICHRHKSKNFP